MSYKPTTVRHQRGAIVIHACDAREANMLMRVVGFTREGLAKTRYLSRPYPSMGMTYRNAMCYLYDPATFDIAIPDGTLTAKAWREAQSGRRARILPSGKPLAPNDP